MTPMQVAYFKQMITTKGMESMFISMYRKYHIKTNPLLLEEFLRKVDYTEVCVKAFYFVQNSRFGFDYWTEMQEQFTEKWEKVALDASLVEWQDLQGVAKELRTNWDAPKHWKYESRAATADRLGFILPENREKILNDDKEDDDDDATMQHEEILTKQGEVFDSHDFSEVPEYEAANGLDMKGDRPKVDERQVPLIEFGDEDEFLSSLEVINLNATKRHVKLGKDEISYNVRSGARITFNMFVSDVIRKRGSYEYATLQRNKAGDVFLILNDFDEDNGIPLNDGRRKSNNDTCDNVTISSKVMCHKLEAFLNISNSYEILKIEEVKRTTDYVAYKLTKKNS